jgi:hypothetical protein
MLPPITTLEDTKTMSMFIAFHAKHPTDAQMREVNPIIRNAVFTALYAVLSMPRSETARSWAELQSQYIPSYWEQPQLLAGYVKSLKSRGEEVEVR